MFESSKIQIRHGWHAWARDRAIGNVEYRGQMAHFSPIKIAGCNRRVALKLPRMVETLATSFIDEQDLTGDLSFSSGMYYRCSGSAIAFTLLCVRASPLQNVWPWASTISDQRLRKLQFFIRAAPQRTTVVNWSRHPNLWKFVARNDKNDPANESSFVPSSPPP